MSNPADIAPRGKRLSRMHLMIGGVGAGALTALVGLTLPWHMVAGEPHHALDHIGWHAAVPAVVALLTAGIAYYWPRLQWLLAWSVIVVACGVGGLLVVNTIEASHADAGALSGMQAFFWGSVAQLGIGAAGLIAVPLEWRGAKRDAEAPVVEGPVAGAFLTD